MYQVQETKSPDTKFENNAYVYENNEVKINYNFWALGGQVEFTITNKLDIPIYIDWNQSHLIFNGSSYEYWYDEEETKSAYRSSTISGQSSILTLLAGAYGSNRTTYGRSATAGLMSSNKKKVKQIIQIPSKSAISISKFNINKTPYFDCDFNLSQKSRKTNSTKEFSIENSPIIFRNFISYSTHENQNQFKIIDNKFYVSSASFISKTKFLGKKVFLNTCNIVGYKKSTNYKSNAYYEYPNNKANTFYIRAR